MKWPFLIALLVLVDACRTAAPSKAPHEVATSVVPLAPGAALPFGFSPATGKTFVEQSRVTRSERHADGTGEPHSETITASLSSHFERAAEGWTVLQRVPSVTISRDGKVWEDKLVQLVTLFPMKLSLTANGEFHALLNPGDAAEAVKKTFTNPIERDTLLGYFTPEALERQAKREWDQKYAGLVGKELKQGAALYSAESIGMTTGGELHYVMERSVAGTTTSPWGEALVMSVRCIAKPEEARDGKALQAVLDAEGGSLEPTSHCEGQQIIARSPFVPVRSWLTFRATPEVKADAPKLEVTLEREQDVHTLE